jgi:hypothetical protein
MDQKKKATEKEKLKQLSAALANKPELTDRLLNIVKLANEPAADGRIRSADEVEQLLIEEVRKLGNQTLVDWAHGVDRRLEAELKAGSPKVQMREKKL